MSTSFYDQMGGAKTFNQLVSHFYALVAVDQVLRPMYPEDDLHGAAMRLQMFLEQYSPLWNQVGGLEQGEAQSKILNPKP